MQVSNMSRDIRYLYKNPNRNKTSNGWEKKAAIGHIIYYIWWLLYGIEIIQKTFCLMLPQYFRLFTILSSRGGRQNRTILTIFFER